MLGTVSATASKVLTLLMQGGPFMFVLLGLSILALTIIVAKFWQFGSRGVGRRRFIGPILESWQARDRDGAIDAIARMRSPVARVMLAAMHASSRMQMDRETLEHELHRVAREQLAALDTGLRGLELVAFLAPLCGFLGTVLGLMGIGNGSASGFEVALVSSAAGLLLSIVAATFYYLFDARIERERRAMEGALDQVLAVPPKRAAPARAAPARRDEPEPEYEEDYDEYEDYDDYDEDEGYYEPEFR